jgi:hypothetical protein
MPNIAIARTTMSRQARLKRRSFFVDETALLRAKRALKLSSDSETIRLSVARVAEMEAFWRFMERSRKQLEAGSIERP